MIIQVSRLHDGSRKITSISEVMGMEGDSVVMEEIFRFEPSVTQPAEKVSGQFKTAGLISRSALRTKARFFGMEDALEQAFQGAAA